MKLLVVPILASLLAIKSCNVTTNMGGGIKGNKNITSTEVTISDYEELVNRTSADVFYEQDPSRSAYLRLETDENLTGYVSIEVKNNKLTISTKENINPSKFKIYTNSKAIYNLEGKGSGSINSKNKLSTENLSISLQGSGNIKVENASCNSIDMLLKGSGDISVNIVNSNTTNALVEGSGDIKLCGNTNKSSLFVKGSGDISAYKLSSKTSNAEIKGSGDIEISVIDLLNAKVTGSGDIKYKGNPEVSKSIKGSGSIKQK